MPSKVHKNNAVRGVSFNVRAGEIVCVAGIDGNGQSELVYGITGLEKPTGGTIKLEGKDITNAPIRERSKAGMSHIPEDRHKHGLVLDYTLADNMVLQRYWQPEFQNHGFIKKGAVLDYAERLIKQYDVRSGQGAATIARSMSGGNQQKAIIAREADPRSGRRRDRVYPQADRGRARQRPRRPARQPRTGRGHEPVRPHPCDL